MDEREDLRVGMLAEGVFDLLRIDGLAPFVVDHHRHAAAALDVLQHAPAEHAVAAHDHLRARRDGAHERGLRLLEGGDLLGRGDLLERHFETRMGKVAEDSAGSGEAKSWSLRSSRCEGATFASALKMDSTRPGCWRSHSCSIAFTCFLCSISC